MLNDSSRVTPDPEVIFTPLKNNEGVLLHLGTRQYFSLNETGVWIWQRLAEGLSLGETARKLEEKYDVTVEKAGQSVLELAEQLVAEKLLKPLPA